MSYVLRTVADVPFGTYPEYPEGPATVAYDGWNTSLTTGAHIEGAVVTAFQVVSHSPWEVKRHELDGKSFPTREAARKAEYDAGLIAYMVYTNSPWY